MRVLVTGGAGFIGSHAVGLLQADGHAVTVIDNLATGSAANLPAGVPLIRHDVAAPLYDVFEQVGPHAVIHLAAQVSVPESITAPLHDLTVNAGGVVNIMEAAARHGVRKVVSISSAAVYGDRAELPLRENSPTRPVSPYGLSKAAGEAYVRLLAKLHGLPFTILRPANIFGPRQVVKGEGAVVPAFLDRFFQGADPIIHGDGTQTRDFLYVADMARAIVQALGAGDGLTLNVSSGTAISVNELWRVAAELVGWRRPPVYGPARVGDIPHSVMANFEARTHLAWSPQVDLAQGLAETVAWYRRA